MQQTTGIEILSNALNFLNNIQQPVLVTDFIKLELTGNAEVDAIISSTSLMMLEYLRSQGMINSDELKVSDAKLYGLTEKGEHMRQEFIRLSSSKIAS